MCHQMIEKALKAAITHIGVEPPYIHNLAKLADRAGVYTTLSDEQKQVLDYLEPLNIQARYPEDKNQLYTSLNRHKCETVIEQTKEVYNWIKAML